MRRIYRGGRIPYFQIDSAFSYQLWFTSGYMAIVYKRHFHKALPLILVLGFVVSFWVRPIVNIMFAIFGISLFYYVAPYCKNIVNDALFKAINRNSFGIYLFHPIIIYAIIFCFRNIQISCFLIFCVALFGSFFLSLLLTELMRKLHLQICIGEKQRNKE